jgi:hypothetical protein
MAEVDQQGDLIGAEADQVFVVAVGDLHGASKGTKDVLGRYPGVGEGGKPAVAHRRSGSGPGEQVGD